MTSTDAGEMRPHCHSPSAMHMGDCSICGNVADAPFHVHPAVTGWIASALTAQEEEIKRLREALRNIVQKGTTTGYGRTALAQIARATLADTAGRAP